MERVLVVRLHHIYVGLTAGAIQPNSRWANLVKPDLQFILPPGPPSSVSFWFCWFLAGVALPGDFLPIRRWTRSSVANGADGETSMRLITWMLSNVCRFREPWNATNHRHTVHILVGVSSMECLEPVF